MRGVVGQLEQLLGPQSTDVGVALELHDLVGFLDGLESVPEVAEARA